MFAFVDLQRSPRYPPQPAGRGRRSTSSTLDLDIAADRGLEKAVEESNRRSQQRAARPAGGGAAEIVSIREALAAHLDGAPD
jgi:hypothetical protein